METALGLAAGALTTGCWLPQLLKSWRTRSAGDLSWVYLAALISGVSLWVAYGAIMCDTSVLAANAFTLLAVMTLVAVKARFGARGRGPLAEPVSRQSANEPVR